MEHREIEFESVDAAVAEVERLASIPTRTTGRFSFPQIVDHLAHAFDISAGTVDPPKMPLLLRLLAPFLVNRAISKPAKPGFKLPRAAQEFFWERNSEELDASLEHFREAFKKYRETDPLPRHPLFGNLTRQQNEQLQCRHMALHLGFVQPADG